MSSCLLLLIMYVSSLESAFRGSILAFAAEKIDPQCEIHCACCIDRKCGQGEGLSDKCFDGCLDGYRGLRCVILCEDSNCKTCDRAGCKECKDGFYLSQTICISCPQNCKMCTSSANCTLCQEGYEIGKSSTCEYSVCPKNCICNRSSCVACKNGFYDNATSCNRTCPATCMTCSSLTECTNCQNGYYNEYNSINRNNCRHRCKENCEICSSYETCQKCRRGKYGQQCLSNCSVGCIDNFCLKESGKCGCKSNFNGNKCDECVTGKYGILCNNSCPNKCKNNVCDRSTGNCIDCEGNFTGEKCDKCFQGTHGFFCNKPCQKNCVDSRCKKDSGECSVGCIINFKGSRCTECVHGKYGSECEEKCPEKCLNGVCDKITGNCSDCIGNFGGDKCTFCKSGVFGPECSKNCSSNCRLGTCASATGKCDGGCKANVSGDKCCVENAHCVFCLSNTECKECKSGFYGQLCDKICPKNCNTSPGQHVSQCSSADGKCLLGCEDGFFGTLCNATCSDYCIDKVCKLESGVCIKGCKSQFEDPVCFHSQARSSEEDTPVSITGPVIGGVVALVVVIGGLVTTVIFIRLKRLRKDTADSDVDHLQQSVRETERVRAFEDRHVYANTTGNEAAKVDVKDFVVGQRGQEEPVGDGADYYNFEPGNLSVKVAYLFSYVTRDHVDWFDKDFKNLPKPEDLSKLCKVAKKPDNIALNRYNGIYPFDHSRVTILGQPNFFINACYIDGYNRRKAYIASFGPTSKTTHHFTSFWQMVWHEKSDIIVMLTNLHEESGMKCEQYWPDAGTEVRYGPVKVACRSVEEYAEYTVRIFTISKGKEQRSLTQLHYTAWPDKGVPSEVTSLIEFRQRVKTVPITLDGPIIVHCSAGVGRTGTYIALDILTEQGKAEDLVDVFHCVSKLRDQRVNMVQTVEQYKFLHKALVHSLTFDCEAVTAEQIQSMAFEADDIFTRIYTTLQKEVDVETEEDIETRKTNRRTYPDKSRRHSDIPGNRCRVRLFLSRKSGNYDYINAVFINSFKFRNLFLAAQTPLPSTVEDFLCLIYQQSASCVVALESPLSTSKKSDAGKYLPADNETYRCGDFTVTSSKFESKSQYVLKKLSIQNAEKGESKTVYHFQYTKWRNDHKVADSPRDFVHFVKEVEKYIGENDTPHIVVHCLNGYERSGLFCVVYKLLEKLEAERQVSVANIVRNIRSQRKLAITSVEQLKFCYQCISTYLESFNIYSNFAV